MDPNHAADVIISSVKKSNLNFYIQESPFSIFINLRKTFIKNRSGNILEQATCDTKNATNDQKIEDEQFEKTRDALSELTVELEKVKAEAHQANKKVEQLENENKVLKKNNGDLQVNIDKLKSEKVASNKNMKSKVKEIERLELENNILEQKIKSSIRP